MFQSYRLRDRVAFCRFKTCTVILDIPEDRYWMISGGTATALAWVDGGIPAAIHPDQLDRLVRLRLIEPARDGQASRLEQAIAPATSVSFASDSPTGAFSLAQAAVVAYLSVRAWISLRTGRLERLIAKIDARRDRSPRTSRGTIEDLAGEFRRYRRLVPLANVCLQDSLALLEFAARRGHHPRLVFGVIAQPFAAHCWVQQDDVVLNDSLDHVSKFSAILVI